MARSTDEAVRGRTGYGQMVQNIGGNASLLTGPGTAPPPVGDPYQTSGLFRNFLTTQGLQGFLEGLVGQPDTASGRSNFNLNKSTQLRDIALRQKELEFQRSTGLRDIGQARTEGLRQVVNNALSRGIFRSGIRRENEARVTRESGEAESDLKTQIQLALDRLANQRRGVAGQKFASGGGGGGISPALAEEIYRRLNGLNANG